MKVLKFGAVWCKDCLVMKPMWAEIEAELPDLETEFFDADEQPEALEKYGVDNLPVFVFLDKNGQEILRLKGLQNKEELLKIVKDNLGK